VPDPSAEEGVRRNAEALLHGENNERRTVRAASVAGAGSVTVAVVALDGSDARATIACWGVRRLGTHRVLLLEEQDESWEL